MVIDVCMHVSQKGEVHVYLYMCGSGNVCFGVKRKQELYS